MARKRGTFRIFYNGLDPSGTGNPGTAWVTGRGFGAFQRPSNTVQQLISYIMSLNPIAYWPLNDAAGSLVAKDITGNGFNGTVSGAVTFGSSGLTSFGETCATFTSGSTQINTSLKSPKQFTLFSVSNISSSGYGATIGNSNGATKLGYWDAANVTYAGQITGQTAAGGGIVNSGVNDFNAVCMPALTFDGTTLSLYQNGTHSAGGNLPVSNDPLIIGQLLTGTIGHVAVFPYAMTAGQITALQNFITAGPVANQAALGDAAGGPLSAMSLGGPARLNKNSGIFVVGSASVNAGQYNYDNLEPLPGQTSLIQYAGPNQTLEYCDPAAYPPLAGSSAVPVAPQSPRGWLSPGISNVPIAFILTY